MYITWIGSLILMALEKREYVELSQYSQIRLWHLSLPSVPGIGEHGHKKGILSCFGRVNFLFFSFFLRARDGRSRKSFQWKDARESGCRVVTTMSRVCRFRRRLHHWLSSREGKGMAIDSRAETTSMAFRVDHLVIALASDERDTRNVNKPRISDVNK